MKSSTENKQLNFIEENRAKRRFRKSWKNQLYARLLTY